MRVARVVCSIFFALVLTIALAAQESITTNPQALPLLRRSLGVLSGAQTLTDVTLSGTASSYDAISKAMLIAMDTEGVKQVVSTIQVKQD